MPEQGTKFGFLTMAEFNKLPRLEKGAYLEKAFAALVEGCGDPTEQSLFKDGPPVPPSPVRKQ